MEGTVYVDLYFMINFSMDFLCLYLTSRLLSHRMSLWRGILSAALGGIYANAALFFTLGRGASVALDVLACILICAVAFFSASEWRRAPLYVLAYTAVSMVLGGFMTALFNLFNRTGIFDGIKESDGDGISVWLFALLAAISAGITLLGGGFFKRKMSRDELELEISYGGKTARLRGMGDSGNLLREPISGKPCIVADVGALSGILPEELIRISRTGDISGLDSIDVSLKKRIVLIPASTVSGSGMLIGLRPDGVTVLIKGKRIYTDAVIALSDLKNGAEGNSALVPTCLLV